MNLRMALPAETRLRPRVAVFLGKAGLSLDNYNGRTRSYRPKPVAFLPLSFKVLREKDIPIQVAIGNYHLGICGGDWVEELLAKYPQSSLLKVSSLGFGRVKVYAAASPASGFSSLEELKAWNSGSIRVVSEYPNLAEKFALGARLPHFKVFAVWGRAEAYPPEHAEIAVLAAPSEKRLADLGLIPLATILSTEAYVVAHRPSYEQVDLTPLLSPLFSQEARAG